MYQPPEYLTLDVAAAVFAEFAWPAPYELEDALPDGILMTFPKSHFLFVEGFESDMALKLLARDTGWPHSLVLGDALYAMRSDPARYPPPQEPALLDNFYPFASLEKVQVGLRNLCTLALAYLRPCILGDFSWIETYRDLRARGE